MQRSQLQSELETLKDGFGTARRDYPAITYLVVCGKDMRLHKDQYRSKPLTKTQRTALIKKDLQVETDAIVQVQPKYEPTKDRIITEWEPEISDLGPEYYERHYLLAPKGNSWDKNNTLANLNALSSDMIRLIIDDPAMRERLLPETYSCETQIGKWLAIARRLQGKDIPKLVFRLSDSGVRTANNGEPYYSVVDDVCLFSIKACDALIQEIREQHDAEKPAGMVQDVHDIANKVDQLITSDKEAKARFTYHITKLCDMVEDYTEALQPYVEKIRRAEKRWKQNKIIGKTLADFCPPPRGWRGIGWRDNLYIKIDMSVIYRPVEPVNPLLWFGLFGNANIQRSPTEKEKLMCDYVLLALVHDWELQYSGTPIDRWIFSTDYKGKWFKRNKFCEDVWMYYHYPCSETFRLSATIQEKLSQLNRALEHVQAELTRKKPADKTQKNEPQEKDGRSNMKQTISEIEYSLALPMKKWSEILGFSENKMKEIREAGEKYHFDKVSKRKWRLPKNELPAEYLEKYRAITRSKPQ